MNTLTPQQAARIANGVYRVQSKSIAEMQRIGERLGCEDQFDGAGSIRFLGDSGALAKSTTGFGYITQGIGPYKGDLLCVTRGTTTMYDWASNLNIGVQNGPGGHLVHAGFNEIWKSTSSSITAYLTGKNPSHIHCVGHSLGGALAMLNADYFTARGIGVTVYTFGAPRVGLDWFASNLTKKIGESRIFRVSHVADPVPMIPILPFSHAPTTMRGYTLGARGGGACISVAAHGMLSSYVPQVGEKSWAAIRDENEKEISDREMQDWLGANPSAEGIMMHSAEGLKMIGRLLRWLMKKAGLMLTGAVGVGLTAGVTLLDQIAWLLARAAEFSKEMAGYGMTFVRSVLKFLGRVATTAVDMTTAFLRYVLDLLFSALSAAATRALSFL